MARESLQAEVLPKKKKQASKKRPRWAGHIALHAAVSTCCKTCRQTLTSTSAASRGGCANADNMLTVRVCSCRDEGDANPEAAALKRPSKVYAGGAKTQRFEKPTVSKRQKNLAKRHGTGKHAFKSKARHKRRK